MIDTIRAVYERFGFEPLETPAIEYVDVLGKNLPESDQPQGGIFAQHDEDDQWIALRYDLTAPLARVYAQHAQSLPAPFRRYQVGPVWRMEKPAPGRFRQFLQFDFDTVGTATLAADAEVCAVTSAALEALGVARGEYEIRINDRKVLNGVLEGIGLPPDDPDAGRTTRLTVLRAVDKLDRLGLDGVRNLLGPGRKDPSGDFTPGAGLPDKAIEAVLAFVTAGGRDRTTVCDRLEALVGSSETGHDGVRELRELDSHLDAMGLDAGRAVFDPSVVRGLSYYTGPVFEAVLLAEIPDSDGQPRRYGSVMGGGRYDDLVKRFTGTTVPATGGSLGVDRLLAALTAMGRLGMDDRPGPVVVTVMDRSRMADYHAMVRELREAGLSAELYLGTGGFRPQIKYADRRHAPVAVIAGGDEFGRGEVSLKDLRLGEALAKTVSDRDAWRKGQPAQVSVPRDRLVAEVRRILEGGAR
jgi:histidyl-tRNA synthetase